MTKIILQLPSACFILVSVAIKSFDKTHSKFEHGSMNEIHTCNSI